VTLVMQGVRKRFGGTVALDGVNVHVRHAEVHALLGENGAGKSTLMKILAGALAPDEGSMSLDGRAFAPRDPIGARDAGVSMIYQELTLAPHLTVRQNLVLGRERVIAPSAVPAALESLGLSTDPDALTRHLPPGERQLVEIARALLGDSRVVVLDEPTSSLGKAEAERVFAAMRRLRELGRAVIFISHHLDEVRAVADGYTILRDGRTVDAGSLAGVTDEQLIERMAGRPLDQLFPARRHTAGEPLLTVEALQLDTRRGNALPIDVSLELRRGEILGLAGLVGAGRTEFLRGLFGLDAVRSGRLSIGPWSTADMRADPGERLNRGVGMLSEDRKTEGLALDLSLSFNTMLSSLGSVARLGFLRRSKLDERTTRWFEPLMIKARTPDQRARQLSGGNQQKVALARLLERDVDIFLLDEPTRGIDVGSKVLIYRLLADLAAKGKSIIVASSVTSELLGLCDRVGVMSRGRLVAVRDAGEWTEESVLAAASSAPAARGSSAA
jgi:ribose transport system ATP-binding protein